MVRTSLLRRLVPVWVVALLSLSACGSGDEIVTGPVGVSIDAQQADGALDVAAVGDVSALDSAQSDAQGAVDAADAADAGSTLDVADGQDGGLDVSDGGSDDVAADGDGLGDDTSPAQDATVTDDADGGGDGAAGGCPGAEGCPCETVKDCDGGLACIESAGTKSCVDPCKQSPPAAEQPCTQVDEDCDGETDELSCDDGNPCTTESCGASGCVFSDNTQACDDGDACTSGEACAGGACGGGQPVVCDDGNPCTDDACDVQSGCVFTNNTKPCGEANQCQEVGVCKDGACASGGSKNCFDGNPCTDDSCDPAKGCVFSNNSSKCDDGDACIKGESPSTASVAAAAPLAAMTATLHG